MPHCVIVQSGETRKFGGSRTSMSSKGAAMRKILIQNEGVATVEFAFVVPILLLLLLGMLEFGNILFTYNTSANAARDVARQLATNRVTLSNADAQVRSELPSSIRSKASVVISQSAPANTAKNQFTVDVSFAAPDAAFSSFANFAYKTLVLHAKVTIQQEYT